MHNYDDRITNGPQYEVLGKAFYTGEGRRAITVEDALSLLEARDLKIAALEQRLENIEAAMIEYKEGAQ